MNPNFDLGSLFGVSQVPGLGYVQTGGSAPAGLGDEAAVMMISGLGAADDQRQVAVGADGVVQSVRGAGLSLWAALTQPVTFLGITLPLWAWLGLLLSGIGIAGWYFFIRK